GAPVQLRRISAQVSPRRRGAGAPRRDRAGRGHRHTGPLRAGAGSASYLSGARRQFHRRPGVVASRSATLRRPLHLVSFARCRAPRVASPAGPERDGPVKPTGDAAAATGVTRRDAAGMALAAWLSAGDNVDAAATPGARRDTTSWHADFP